MITSKTLDFKEEIWKEEVPNAFLINTLTNRVLNNKLDNSLLSIVTLYCTLNSPRPLKKVLNLLEVDKEAVEILSAPVESTFKEWTISKCDWEDKYTYTPIRGYYWNRKKLKPATIKLKFPVIKFEDKANKKFFLITERKNLADNLARRHVNGTYSIIPSGTHSMSAAVETLKRYVSNV